MITHFVFTVGLPGCGKSTYLKEHYKNAFDYKDYYMTSIEKESIDEYCCKHIKQDEYAIIAADDIKLVMAGYSADHPENVHEDSVQLARNYVFRLAMSKKFTGGVIMDGGGLNNNYTNSIIQCVRQNCPDAKITCLFFDTPINICMERVNQRERKIPEDAFFKKNLMISDCISRYQDLSDEYVRVDYFTNKYLFLDMDGTIVSYRKGKLDAYGNTDFVNSHLFLNARPVQHIIDYVKQNFDMKNVFIITAVANCIVLDEKIQWMKKYFPEVPLENFLWVGNKQYKHVFLDHFSLLKKFDKKDMTIVDDMHETLHKCAAIGINAIHPSNIYALTDKFATLG